MQKFRLLLIALIAFSSTDLLSQEHSVAREWNELSLNAVRNGRARPTVTARNMSHLSTAMYDAWSVYDDIARPYFLGQTVGNYYVPFNGIPLPGTPEEIEADRKEAISYAAYRLLSHRNANLPGNNEDAVLASFDNYMNELGYPTDVTSTAYEPGDPAALGNYIAEQIIAYGFQDGSFEQDSYANQYYEPVNPPLVTQFDGNPDMVDPNRWQPLTLIVAIDQAGIPFPLNTPEFLGPEWGNVDPFALTDEDKTTYSRDENLYHVYCDPGPPVHINDTTHQTGLSDRYKWNYAMDIVWSSLLAHDNGVMIDVSPNNIGNVLDYPETMSIEDLEGFYDFFTGLDGSQGYDLNPSTGLPYDVQMVPMGDYGRVLAEFWADGPDSETPPGHWYTIMNYVNDHPDLEKRWMGEGEILDDLEWDIKSYMALGGAMHDCAISSWGIKGYYDYVRPISAIRYMGDQGQSSDSTLVSYSPSGLPLIPGYIEIVDDEDPLVGVSQEHLNKIKVMSWKGPDYLDHIDLNGEIIDGVQDSTIAGVDWILTEDWWPYQRPSFVSPPFAGYISGHSTFSRAGAHVLEAITGDEYFPGGMGVFDAPQDNFLVFETGPSQFLELQWAKYKDASDQCSLSRIFGGIHPPEDDIPGRKIGVKIGAKVFNLVDSLANSDIPRIILNTSSTDLINDALTGSSISITVTYNREMDVNVDPTLSFSPDISSSLSETSADWTTSEAFTWTYIVSDDNYFNDNVSYTVDGAMDLEGMVQEEYYRLDPFIIDTENPTISIAEFNNNINENLEGMNVNLLLSFNESMNSSLPTVTWTNEDPTINSLVLNVAQPEWISASEFALSYEVIDANEELYNMQLLVSGVMDEAGNPIENGDAIVSSFLDTKVPILESVTAGQLIYNESNAGLGTITISAAYDDEMGETPVPVFEFNLEDPGSSMVLNSELSGPNGMSYDFVFDLIDLDLELDNIDVSITGLSDDAGNTGADVIELDVFSIDTKAPVGSFGIEPTLMINESNTGSQLLFPIEFDELMDIETPMLVEYSPSLPASLTLNAMSDWNTGQVYTAFYDISDQNDEVILDVQITSAQDLAGNPMVVLDLTPNIVLDNRGPEGFLTANTYDVTENNIGAAGFQLFFVFDAEVNQEMTPQITFENEDPSASLTLNQETSGWLGSTYKFDFDVENDLVPLAYIDVSISNAEDLNGNSMNQVDFIDYFSIQLDTFLTINELEFDQLKVYPNPVYAGQYFTLEVKNVQEFEVELYNLEGRLLNQSLNLVGTDKLEISTIGLASGKYFVKLKSDTSVQVLRIEVLN